MQLPHLESRAVGQLVGVGASFPGVRAAEVHRQELELAGAETVVFQRFAAILERHHPVQKAALGAVDDRGTLAGRPIAVAFVDDAAAVAVGTLELVGPTVATNRKGTPSVRRLTRYSQCELGISGKKSAACCVEPRSRLTVAVHPLVSMTSTPSAIPITFGPAIRIAGIVGKGLRAFNCTATRESRRDRGMRAIARRSATRGSASRSSRRLSSSGWCRSRRRSNRCCGRRSRCRGAR